MGSAAITETLLIYIMLQTCFFVSAYSSGNVWWGLLCLPAVLLVAAVVGGINAVFENHKLKKTRKFSNGFSATFHKRVDGGPNCVTWVLIEASSPACAEEARTIFQNGCTVVRGRSEVVLSFTPQFHRQKKAGPNKGSWYAFVEHKDDAWAAERDRIVIEGGTTCKPPLALRAPNYPDDIVRI